MPTTRLEAFSDAVLAIVITLMVLELHIPEGSDLEALRGTATGFLTFALSFIYVGIYWNNHHHLFQVVESVTGSILWANLHLLFWLSLFPFTTAWMDETDFAATPVVVFGLDLLLAAVAFYLLEKAIIRSEGGQALRMAVGRDWKGKASMLIYAAGIALTAVSPALSLALYALVAVMWLVPDRRVERHLRANRA